MVADPFAAIRDWGSSLYWGTPAAVEQFLDAIDSALPADWNRDRTYEQTRPRPDRLRCYLFDRVGDAAVRVWLERVTATRVRGGPIQVLRHPPPGDAVRVGRLVAEFADGCTLPAANTAGVRYTRPTFGPRSAVTGAAENLFTQFADTADGEWPLSEQTKAVWDELISGCLMDKVGIDRTELGKWLADSGWGQEPMTALVDQFFVDSEWLARRLAVTAP